MPTAVVWREDGAQAWYVQRGPWKYIVLGRRRVRSFPFRVALEYGGGSGELGLVVLESPLALLLLAFWTTAGWLTLLQPINTTSNDSSEKILEERRRRGGGTSKFYTKSIICERNARSRISDSVRTVPLWVSHIHEFPKERKGSQIKDRDVRIMRNTILWIRKSSSSYSWIRKSSSSIGRRSIFSFVI